MRLDGTPRSDKAQASWEERTPFHGASIAHPSLLDWPEHLDFTYSNLNKVLYFTNHTSWQMQGWAPSPQLRCRGPLRGVCNMPAHDSAPLQTGGVDSWGLTCPV